MQQDMSGHNVMSSLVQGDVGSGKTIVAVAGHLCIQGLNGYPGGYDGADRGSGKTALRKYYIHVADNITSHCMPSC